MPHQMYKYYYGRLEHSHNLAIYPDAESATMDGATFFGSNEELPTFTKRDGYTAYYATDGVSKVWVEYAEDPKPVDDTPEPTDSEILDALLGVI